jgi:hypothetical protein
MNQLINGTVDIVVVSPVAEKRAGLAGERGSLTEGAFAPGLP